MRNAVLIVYLFLLSFALSNYAVASNCNKEKEMADYYNDQLKNNSIEYWRSKHRVAKQVFLDCLREEKKAKSTASTSGGQLNSNTRPSTKSSTKKSKIRISKNATTTSYANFKGKKLIAWNEFFKEPSACLKNNGDMAIFVKCSTHRKKQLSIFESRWNEAEKKLRPLIY